MPLPFPAAPCRAWSRTLRAASALCLAGAALLSPWGAQGQSTSTLQAFGAARYGLGSAEVAVVINEADPDSVEIGRYYLEARRIPTRNLVRVHLDGSPHRLSAAQFEQLKRRIDAQLSDEIQVVVFAWTAPYAVECNSLTAAFTLGFDAGQCSHTCGPGKSSPYFDSPSLRPYSDLGLRLSMLLPIPSPQQARALIDRGAASDGRAPRGSAYLLSTSDPDRNVRAPFFPPSRQLQRPPLAIRSLQADSIEGRRDVMFYLTGLRQVPKLETLRFLPGALADHLTSSGGDLLGTSQMSSLRWLEAGATASYGTVSEPCNHWQKFPHPAVLLRHYLAGASAVEAYWKSVAWPTQGLFIGEPLASPYRRR